MKLKSYSNFLAFINTKKHNMVCTFCIAVFICIATMSHAQAVLIEKTTTCTRPPTRPGPISGPKYDLCELTSITLSIAPVANATSYTWTIPDGFTILQDNGTSIELGLGTGYHQVEVSVTANNDCGSSLPRAINLFSNPTRVAGISGPTCVLPFEENLVYSVTNPEVGTTYTWYVPGIVQIIDGQGTPTVTVKWRSYSGSIGVRPFNACGNNGRVNLYVTVGCTAVANAAKNSNVTIFPNPVSSVATVSFNSNAASAYTLKITDATGKLMQSKTGTATAGTNNILVNMNDYVTGIYFASITTTEGTRLIKIMKD